MLLTSTMHQKHTYDMCMHIHHKSSKHSISGGKLIMEISFGLNLGKDPHAQYVCTYIHTYIHT